MRGMHADVSGRCVQLLNILFLGNEEAKGVFFPEGVLGKINSPKGYDAVASGLDDFPASVAAVGQVLSTSGALTPASHAGHVNHSGIWLLRKALQCLHTPVQQLTDNRWVVQCRRRRRSRWACRRRRCRWPTTRPWWRAPCS